MVMLEKVADRGFLAFWPFENEWKFRKSVKLPQKIWNLAKSEYYPPRHHWAAPLYSLCTARHSISNASTTTTGTSPTKPWNARVYYYHTSYYADHQFPTINTNHFVIHRCEFYLCLNWTVLFICLMTKHETAPCLRIIINWERHRKNYKKITGIHCKHSFSILGHMKKILHNFQWTPPSETQKQADQTLKTSSCEISFWALRRVSLAIVTYFDWINKNHTIHFT